MIPSMLQVSTMPPKLPKKYQIVCHVERFVLLFVYLYFVSVFIKGFNAAYNKRIQWMNNTNK